MKVKASDDGPNRSSQVRKFWATVLGGICNASPTDNSESPPIEWPLRTGEGDEPTRKHWIAVVDGPFVDHLNRRPTATVSGDVDMIELNAFLEDKGAIRKFFLPGPASSVDGNIVRDGGFYVWHQRPLRPSVQRVPGDSAFVECVKGRFADVTLSKADGLIVVTNGDDKARVLQEALNRELDLLLISRWDLLTPGLRALLNHPLAFYADIRADVGAA